jgi:shikimate kinase
MPYCPDRRPVEMQHNRLSDIDLTQHTCLINKCQERIGQCTYIIDELQGEILKCQGEIDMIHISADRRESSRRSQGLNDQPYINASEQAEIMQLTQSRDRMNEELSSLYAQIAETQRQMRDCESRFNTILS